MRLFAFRGIRYAAGGREAGDLVAPPYDQINDTLRDRLQTSSPLQFAHLIRPLPDPQGDPYRNAAEIHQSWRRDGVLTQDDRPALYPYVIELAAGGRRLGLCALVGVEEPESGIIRPHEQTLEKPLADRLALLRAMRVDLEPVLLLADDAGALEELLREDLAQATPVVDHGDLDGNRHLLFRVANRERVRRYQRVLASTPAAIADGHHRYKVGLLYARESGAQPSTGAAAKLAVVTSLASDHLRIDPIHRGLRHLPDLTTLHRLLASRESCAKTSGSEIAEAVAKAEQPAIAVWPRGGQAEGWRLDPLAAESRGLAPASARLPVTLLHDLLFPSLGLPTAAATDGTVLYRPDPDELLRLLIAGEVSVGFFLPPMRPAEFAAAIAAGDLLPPKSTRFLPKVMSGLVWAEHDSPLL